MSYYVRDLDISNSEISLVNEQKNELPVKIQGDKEITISISKL